MKRSSRWFSHEKALNTNDPSIGWFKIVKYIDRNAASHFNSGHVACICIYPRPKTIIYDNGNELIGHAFKSYMIQNEYWTKSKCATRVNSQAKSNLKKITKSYQTLYTSLTKKLPRQGWTLGRYTRRYCFCCTKYVPHHVIIHFRQTVVWIWHDINAPFISDL